MARRALHLTDDDYRAPQKRVARVDSSKELDDFCFGLVMGAFRQLGFKSDFAEKNFGGDRRAEMAAANQVALIRDLWSQCTDGRGTEAGFDLWLETRYKV